MEANYFSIFQLLESEVLFKCFMMRSHNLWMQSDQERRGYPLQVMFTFFDGFCLSILNAVWDSSAKSQLSYLERPSLNFSGLSFVIRVSLLHP